MASLPTLFYLVLSLGLFLSNLSLTKAQYNTIPSFAYDDSNNSATFSDGLNDSGNEDDVALNIFSNSRKSVEDLQTFSGALGGIRAPKITMSTDGSKPFQVEQETYPDFNSAGERTCTKQLARCQAAASKQYDVKPSEPAVLSGIESKVAFNITDCVSQKLTCESAQRSAPFQTFSLDNLGPDPNDPSFDLYCAPDTDADLDLDP